MAKKSINSRQNLISLSLLFIIAFTPILLFVKTITNPVFGDGFYIDTYVLYTIQYLLLLTVLIKTLNNMKTDLIILILFFPYYLLFNNSYFSG